MTLRCCSLLAGIAGLLLWATSARADDAWDRFRGPNGSGVAAACDLPLSWDEKDYLWRVELQGVGHSSPVIRDGRLFITTADDKQNTRSVHCHSIADGKVLWHRDYPLKTHKKNASNSFASATAALDDRRAFVAFGTPEEYLIVALDQASGRELWKQDLGPYDAEHGFGGSPIVYRDLVIAANVQNSEGNVVALDRQTGKIVWKTPRKGERAAYSTPCLYQPAQGPAQLILTGSAHGFTSLDPQTGKLNWELPLFKARVVGSPIVLNDLILGGSGGGGAGRELIAVRPGDATGKVKPEKVYEIKAPIPYVPSPVLHDGRVFLCGDGGIFTCADAATGEIVWRERIDGKFFASPVLVGDRLYCASRDGEMVVLSAGATYKLLARFAIGEGTNATPAVAGGVMYIRTPAHLMAIAAKKAK